MTESTVSLPRSYSTERWTRWSLALVIATLGDLLFWQADPGINWGLWILVGMATLWYVIWRRYGRVGRAPLMLGSAAIVLSFGLAVTTQDHLRPFIIAGTLGLVALTLATSDAPAWEELLPRHLLLGPLQAFVWTLKGAGHELLGTGTHLASRDSRASLRGVIIATPIVIVLFLLLASADPMFDAVREWLATLVPDFLGAQAVFFTLLLILSLGAYAGITRDISKPVIPAPKDRALSIGSAVERQIVLTSVAILLWLFVVSALVSLWRDPAGTVGTGVSYAEYARRGFGEVSVAVTLVIVVVLGTQRFQAAGFEKDRAVQRTAAAALCAIAIMVGIAFVRVLQYEAAYGYTTSRVYAQAYMLVLWSAIAILAMELRGPVKRGEFTRRLWIAGLTVFIALVYWNSDAWIAGKNIDRYRTTGHIDLMYLARSSPDAAPAIAERLHLLHGVELQGMRQWLSDVRTQSRSTNQRWFEWNWRHAKAGQVP